jgi:hypothetical protein
VRGEHLARERAARERARENLRDDPRGAAVTAGAAAQIFLEEPRDEPGARDEAVAIAARAVANVERRSVRHVDAMTRERIEKLARETRRRAFARHAGRA